MNDTVTRSLHAYGGTLSNSGGRALPALEPHDDALAAVMYASPPYTLAVPPLAVARLSINLSPARVTGGLDGAQPREFVARRHSIFLTPAGAGAHWRKDSSSRHINVYFNARAFEHPDDAAWGPLLANAEPLLNASLTGGAGLIDMLAAELGTAHPFSAEAVDSLARLILLRLARQPSQAAPRANPLTPAVHARVVDYTLANLDQRVLVADLAAVAGLTPNRFAQAFTAARGESPHQFVLRLRLEQALQRLHQTAESLADVAAACGFASQQHLTRVMRTRLGVTPARERLSAQHGHAAAPPRGGGNACFASMRLRDTAAGTGAGTVGRKMAPQPHNPTTR